MLNSCSVQINISKLAILLTFLIFSYNLVSLKFISAKDKAEFATLHLHSAFLKK